MSERHSKDCKVSVGSKTTAHRREIRLDSQRLMLESNVRFGSKADMCSAQADVRSYPKSGHVQCNSVCPLCANSGHPRANRKTALRRSLRNPIRCFDQAVACAFRFPRHHASRPPPANKMPGRPAPTMGPGTLEIGILEIVPPPFRS
jgi:hypothetical protein